MDLKKIHNKFRPLPFWSWNDKLNTEETKHQVGTMKSAGLGGFFMHARGGLKTGYLSDEWFDNITAASDEAQKLKIRPWAYDENGWPSGFGDGKVTEMGLDFLQKKLCFEKENTHPDTFIAKSGNLYFYYEVNPYYIDVLNPDVVREFIRVAYEPYYKIVGNGIEGFFTDEPQVARCGYPWSFTLDKEYKKHWGEDLKEHLSELVNKCGNYKKTRMQFWKTVTDLFRESYFKQIYDWCEEKGYKLTGHLVLEDEIHSQLPSCGSAMAQYEYFHIPGMDWLTDKIIDCFSARQVSSVACQLGKEATISESFAFSGHSASFSKLKGIYEWQMVRGINLLCPHLEGYSLRGLRKRDFPPALFYQQPWWKYYDKWCDAVSRTGQILSSGNNPSDILVISPQTTAWTLYDGTVTDELKSLNNGFLKLVKNLEQKHIIFHLGDETIIENHGRIKDGCFCVGNMCYSRVIISGCDILFDSTKKLLRDFEMCGGSVIGIEDVEPDNVVSEPSIEYMRTDYDDFCVHYFVNPSPDEVEAKINANGKAIDIYTGELVDFNHDYTFEPWGSLLVYDDGTKNGFCEKNIPSAQLCEKFRIKNSPDNVLVLDKCDYYFDGVLEEKNGYVLNICERANNLERKVHIHQDYFVQAEYVPSVMHLVCETPELFEICVNGKPVSFKDDGYFVDKSFRKTEISEYMKPGRNVISFDVDFCQSDEFYAKLNRAKCFESEKNNLNYDMEIEAVYLVGDFSVKTNPELFTDTDNDCLIYGGEFVVSAPSKEVTLSHIEKQGFPFFCGTLELEGEVFLPDDNCIMEFDLKGVNGFDIKIGDFRKTLITQNNVLINHKKGMHKVTLSICNNLRNMLGPHHTTKGRYNVSHSRFYKEDCIWGKNDDYTDDYCFSTFGTGE